MLQREISADPSQQNDQVKKRMELFLSPSIVSTEAASEAGSAGQQRASAAGVRDRGLTFDETAARISQFSLRSPFVSSDKERAAVR